jgi:hypothetical protein
MRTDLTHPEHMLLQEISDHSGFAWLSPDDDKETNSCIASLIDRGLVRIQNVWFIYITDDGELLLRMYGEP